MGKLIDNIPEIKRAQVLEELLDAYVGTQGLGAMPKQDFDALVIHLYLKHSKKKYDPFELSKLFKIRESRLKSLRALGAVKYGNQDELNNWTKIIAAIKDGKFDVANRERGDIRFKLTDPSFFRFV